ncbi:hypothetical protein QWY97_17785 [Vibrio cortegadensis]|uniref:hypothetical protein n=1 Tax=Vibrio cortegadensis TaxID=1328770 RepID=UPI0021C400D8|nr:hypothetical protein [Vibrio cortegadensis]MDN3699178.1 hypothetical protein [Vibrio cortegadensis]
MDIDNEKQIDRQITYIEKHVVPWQIAHLQMRSQGLQIFIAIQAAILFSYAKLGSWGFIVLGLICVYALYRWDTRNRFVISELHRLGVEYADKAVFGISTQGKAKNGLHFQGQKTLEHSNNLKNLFGSSHTATVRFVCLSIGFMWLILIFVPMHSYGNT